MPKRRAAAILILALILGIALPWLGALLQDAACAGASWPLDNQTDHYAYQGTLMNRVRALQAYMNYSPAVEQTEHAPAPPPDALLERLSALLPFPEEATCECASFSLIPRQYAAEYAYLSAVWTAGDSSLDVLADAETGLPLRIQLNCAPALLKAFLEEHEFWQLLHEYADVLGYAELADGKSTVSSLFTSQSAGIRGTSFSITVTAAPSQGLLLFTLTASS